MPVSNEKGVVTVCGDPGNREVKAALELLDRSGLSYKHQDPPRTPLGGDQKASLSCAGKSLTDLSREAVLGFLREHGAQFEDS